jgi:lipoprotein-releasing system ATP-binding protein
MTEQKIILKAINLHKHFPMGRSSRLHVLKGLDFEVYEGEIVAILGPSGVGKSTLLHILGALDRPTEGLVKIDDIDIFTMNNSALAKYRSKTTGFIFQFHHLLPEFSAYENVMMPALIAGQPKETAKKQALKLLSEVGLEERANHRPTELSGGEQQRVAVARALTNNPRIVLADEPSGNLDLRSSEELHNLLWQLSRQYHRTFIIVTHNLELASRSDRIIELYDGRIKRDQIN